MNKIGLYIHVPYCRRKCAYCDFYSLGGEMPGAEYTGAVIRNIRAYGESYDTVYFGGGTPSLLSSGQVYDILCAADIAEGAEISAEINPESADIEKLSGFFSAGINRISFGVQSLCDRELNALGRLHDAKTAEAAIKNAHKAGFENISADLMLGIPCQDESSVKSSIERLCASGVNHISAYILKIEEGTPLSLNKELTESCADPDKAADLYELTVNELQGHGLFQYEISNFAQKGRECRHNLKYWQCGEYIGIGPSAHSLYKGKRFSVPRDIHGFIEADRQKEIVTDDTPCSLSERIMLALRLSEGFELSQAGSMADRIIKKAAPLEKYGLLTIKDGRIALTVKGFLVSNEIICRLTD